MVFSNNFDQKAKLLVRRYAGGLKSQSSMIVPDYLQTPPDIPLDILYMFRQTQIDKYTAMTALPRTEVGSEQVGSINDKHAFYCHAAFVKIGSFNISSTITSLFCVYLTFYMRSQHLLPSDSMDIIIG